MWTQEYALPGTCKSPAISTLYIFLLLVNGLWGQWHNWSSCSVTCGGGNQTRKRLCDNPTPAYGGMDCAGDDERAQVCNQDPCPGKES